MSSRFYIVQKNGVPAVWQSNPDRIEDLLRQKPGFTLSPETPTDTRAEALIKLRLIFPGCRPIKSR
jgi:hypothetical protein